MDGPARAPRPAQRRQWLKTYWPFVPAIAVGLSVVFGLLTTVTYAPPRPVPCTEFKQLVRSDKITAVTIGRERLRGTLREGEQQIVAFRIEDPGLVKELEDHHVTATAPMIGGLRSSGSCRSCS
jgi:hypothetical protein